jgi:SAM-dependent methyltransferase
MAQDIKPLSPEFDNRIEYASVTEAPGLMATGEQLARLYHRYRFALEFAEDRDVLEVACGTGIGLGLLAESAKRVVGGDIDAKNLSIARNLYKNKPIELREMNAHRLQLDNASFDLIVFFEAIYYLKYPERFIEEARRVLRDSGRLVVCSVNRDWKDFHPSPFAEKYYSVEELRSLLAAEFRHVDVYGAFPVAKGGFRTWCISVLKRAAVSLDLIPGSLKTRAYLKRLFFGPLQAIPDRVYRDMTDYEPPTPIDEHAAHTSFKIIYAVATK